MRYTRLRRQIESGTLIGTHGSPFLSSSPPTFEKRKRKGMSEEVKGEDESEEEIGGLKLENGGRGKRDVKGEKDRMVKEEEVSDFESSGSESEEWDSEDEVPLAKLRKAKLRGVPALQTLPTQLADGQRNIAPREPAGGYQGTVSGAAVPRLVPGGEGSVWEGMIPVGGVGVDSAFHGYGGWGNGFQGSNVGGLDQGLQIASGKPRKSV